MTKNRLEDVIKFVSDYTEIPEEDLSGATDVVSDIPWATFHEDEQFESFVEQYIQAFRIRVPEQDFTTFAKKKELPWYSYPFWYLAFVFVRPQFQVESITIYELAEIATRGSWSVTEENASQARKKSDTKPAR